MQSALKMVIRRYILRLLKPYVVSQMMHFTMHYVRKCNQMHYFFCELSV